MSGRAAIALVVVVASVAAGALAVLSGDPSPGPLARDVGEPNTIAFDVEIGQPFSYGLVVLRNPASREVRITGVELADPWGRIELLEAGVRSMHDLPDHGLVANDRVYPPVALAGSVAPAIGARVPPLAGPRDAVELVLGLRADGAGSSGFHGVIVSYELDRATHRALFPFALTVCAPPSGRRCDRAG